MHDRRAVFSDPLTERAVRASLGMGEGEFLSEDMLEGVKGIYLVADTPCADMDSFFAAVNGWHAAGRPVRGTLRNLEDLSGITRLESLDISHTAVTDLSPITARQGLRRLKMTQVPAADLRPLMELPLLEMVILSPDMKEPAAELEGCRFAIVYE